MIKESPIIKFKTRLHAFKTYLTLPNFVQIESTTKCNMNCKQCIRGPEENYDMSFEFFKSIIDGLDYSKSGTQHVDLTGVGEPLLNPDLLSMVNYAKKKEFRVSFTSNFKLMCESKSIDVIKSWTYRVVFAVSAGDLWNGTITRIFKNWVAVWTERTNYNTRDTFTEDLQFSAWDSIELWWKRENSTWWTAWLITSFVVTYSLQNENLAFSLHIRLQVKT